MDNGTLDFSLFYSDGLHLVQKGNLKLGKSILKAIDSTITGSRIPSRYKNAVCSTDFNLNLEDFPTLPRTVPVCNPVSFNKSKFKFVSTSSVQVNPFVIVMFLQVNLLVLVLFVQVNPLLIEMSVRVKL